MMWDKVFMLPYVKYSDKYMQVCGNSVDPDQTVPIGEFDQGLHCLPFCQYFLDTSKSSETW